MKSERVSKAEHALFTLQSSIPFTPLFTLPPSPFTLRGSLPSSLFFYHLPMRTLTALALLMIATASMAQTPPKFEVLALRYATIPQFPVAALVKGAEESRKIDIAMMVWLVSGGGRNNLVDPGFYRQPFLQHLEAT